LSCFTTRLSLRGQDCSRTGTVIHTTRYEPADSYRANDKCAEVAYHSFCGKNLEGLGVTDAVPFFAPRTFETLLSAKSSSTTTTRLEQLISGSQLVIFNKFFGKKMVLTVGSTNGLSGSYRLRRVPRYFLAYRTKHTPPTPTRPPYFRER